MYGLDPLVPAYGRDYKSRAAVEKDFNEGKDFITPRGQSTNKIDLLSLGVKSVNIRYQKKTKVTVVKVV